MSENGSLLDLIKEKRTQVQIQAYTYDMNWISQKVLEGEIIIRPNYQRLFQWSTVQQSRFIESLILNLPIPPLHFIELEDERRELLDGLQRISSYLHFTNQMPEGFNELIKRLNSMSQNEQEDDEKEDSEVSSSNAKDSKSLVLEGCDIIPELNGKKFEELDDVIKRRLKNKAIDFYVYTSTSKWMRYQMFTRMNAGGETLNAQQIRNAKIRTLGESFITFLEELSKADYYECFINKFFSDTYKINRKMEREEHILRLLAFAHDAEHYDKEIGSFLDNYLEKVTLVLDEPSEAPKISFDIEDTKNKFQQTCELLCEHITEKPKLNPKGRESKYIMESIFVTVFNHLDKITSNPAKLQTLQNQFDSLPQEVIHSFTGGGKNTLGYYNKRINTIEKLLGVR
ncbi:MAG: DUF262 domain-containing protein [Vampirovibrionales bacterium]